MGTPGSAFLPLRRYADFRGRATRAQLVLFLVLVGLIEAALDFATPLVGERNGGWIDVGLAAILACPILALKVRRLHDTGRSGWWLLIGLPLFGLGLWEAWRRFAEPLAPSPIDTLPLAARAALALSAVVYIVLLLWDEEESDNGYGPNPRYAAAVAQTA